MTVTMELLLRLSNFSITYINCHKKCLNKRYIPLFVQTGRISVLPFSAILEQHGIPVHCFLNCQAPQCVSCFFTFQDGQRSTSKCGTRTVMEGMNFMAMGFVTFQHLLASIKSTARHGDLWEQCASRFHKCF